MVSELAPNFTHSIDGLSFQSENVFEEYGDRRNMRRSYRDEGYGPETLLR